MLKSLFTLSSSVNVLAGAVLSFTWASNWATDPQHHVPIVVLALGGAMLIQGLYSVGYSLSWWDAWGDIAVGALLAGELISGCAGLALLVAGLAHNSSSNDGEMAPVLAGLLIGINALIALVIIARSGKLSARGFVSRRGSVWI